MRDLALNFTSTHQAENPRGFSEVGENKQLLIAIVVRWLFIFLCSNISVLLVRQIFQLHISKLLSA
ncbi:hypothetical protein C7H52_11190 [Aurantibacter aestuarii]|uniref:Uncharacterized protein n=1 Tax=Aurantibacter aestuarii TaxID=1266046 RepID=A0A2T1N744_9FLAO|nr:hypothetical protein C7H52_11190 [Aurantibacter aestuarii]